MGGYLASREVLTAADRRQTMPAGDIRQMCVSPDLIPVMDTCVRPAVSCVAFWTSLPSGAATPPSTDDVRILDAKRHLGCVFHLRTPGVSTMIGFSKKI